MVPPPGPESSPESNAQPAAQSEPPLGPKQTIPSRLMKLSNGKIKKHITVWGDNWLRKRNRAASRPPFPTSHQQVSAVRRQIAEPQPSSTPIMAAYPVHQDYIHMADLAFSLHQSPTAQGCLPIDHSSIPNVPKGEQHPLPSSYHPRPLIPGYDNHARNTHTQQHPGGVQHDVHPYTVSQPIKGDSCMQYTSQYYDQHQHSTPQTSMNASYPNPRATEARKRSIGVYHPYPAQAMQRHVNAQCPYPDAFNPYSTQAGQMSVDMHHLMQTSHMDEYHPYSIQDEYLADLSHANWNAEFAYSSVLEHPYYEV